MTFGYANEKQEGWSYCTYCNAEAPPGEDFIHEPWCPPPDPPSRWERFKSWLAHLR